MYVDAGVVCPCNKFLSVKLVTQSCANMASVHGKKLDDIVYRHKGSVQRHALSDTLFGHSVRTPLYGRYTFQASLCSG